jgi:hypothetical protein
MARASPTDPDLYLAMKSGSLAGAAEGEWVPMPGGRAVNVWVSGPFVATWQLQASYDGGATAMPVSLVGQGFEGPYSQRLKGWTFEQEANVLYRVACIAYTSGTLTWRISS